ncbi:uncharacterized protein LOC136031840 [Artemia franciscana]|uniref:uncharacterized protein LOC136031840 n=1 Tax=Artemia franciscana TaxID=6661 RepID=UPI0032DAF4BA
MDMETIPPSGNPRSSRSILRRRNSDNLWPPGRSSSRDKPRNSSRDREIPKVPRPISVDRIGRSSSRERPIGTFGDVQISWPPEYNALVGATVVNMGALHSSHAYTQARKVAWPPKSPHTSFDHGESLVRRSMSPVQAVKVPPPVPRKPGKIQVLFFFTTIGVDCILYMTLTRDNLFFFVVWLRLKSFRGA